MSAERFPKPPELFTVNTGEGQKVQDVIQHFFGEVLDYLEYNQEAIELFTSIETRILQRQDEHGRPFQTDDLLTLLRVQDYITASVLESRDERNFVQVVSACYLTPQIVEELKKDKRLLVTRTD